MPSQFIYQDKCFLAKGGEAAELWFIGRGIRPRHVLAVRERHVPRAEPV